MAGLSKRAIDLGAGGILNSPPPCGEGLGVEVVTLQEKFPPPRRASRVDPPHQGEGKDKRGGA